MRFKDTAAQPCCKVVKWGGKYCKSTVFFSSSTHSSGKRETGEDGNSFQCLKRKEQWERTGVKPFISKGRERLLTTIYVSLHLAHCVSKSHDTAHHSMQIPQEKSWLKLQVGCSFVATKRLQKIAKWESTLAGRSELSKIKKAKEKCVEKSGKNIAFLIINTFLGQELQGNRLN